jgi:hypothetical protein
MSDILVPEYKGKPGPDGPSKYTDEFIVKLTGLLQDYTHKTSYPIWDEFCHNVKIIRLMRKELCERNREFSYAFEDMMAKQAAFLNRAGISGKTNSGFVKFLMINNHKKDDGTSYRDKQDHELSGPGGAPLAPPQIIFESTAPGEAKQ